MTRIVPANQSLFLWEIERKLAGKECISYDSTTLEHIMPQTLNDEWRDSLGDNADDIHDRCLGLLGNLSLTKTNSELSNHAFAEKKTMYQKSGFKLNCELANHFDCWGEEEIKKRGEWLAEQAIRVWKYPERNTGIITKIGLEMTWTSRNPVRLYIDNNETFVSLWKEVFMKILDYMFHIDKESFLFFAKQKGSWLIVDNDESYHLAEKSHSAEDMRKFVLKACEHMTIPVETFTVGVTK